MHPRESGRFRDETVQKDPDDILRDDRAYVWHPFTWMPRYLAREALVITGAEGIYLIAADGRPFMDGTASMWLNVHGHNRPEIREAIVAQLDRFAHVSVFGQTHAPAAELARRLVEVTAAGLNHVFYSDDGATAVEVALKLAFQHAQIRGETNRTKFLALRHAYHGDTLGAVSVGDIEHFHHAFRPLLFECIHAPSPGCAHCELGRDMTYCEIACLDELEKIMARQAAHLCAFVVEPIVQGAAGMLVAKEGYLRGARDLCTRHGVPMIADEVFTGFGRTGRMFACEHEDVSPDILCLAKGLTGGTIPLAATLTTDRIYEAFLGDDPARCTFFHGHSYTANPLACAAALASLDVFEKDDTLAHVQALEKMIASDAERFRKLPHASGVRFKGLVFAFDVVADEAPLKPYDASERMGQKVCDAAMTRGLLIRPLGDTVYLVPPLVTTEAQLRQMLDIVHDAVREVTG